QGAGACMRGLRASALGSSACRVSALSAGLLFCSEQIEIDCHAHREIAGPVRVQLVSRSSDRAVRHKFRLEAAGLRIERRLVEVDHTIKQARGANELVERLALLVLLEKAVR